LVHRYRKIPLLAAVVASGVFCSTASAVDYAAEYVTQDQPPLLAPGTEGYVTLYLRNIGTATWGPSVRLGSLTPHQDDPIANATGGTLDSHNRVPFTDTTGDGKVAPGELARFNYSVRSDTATAYKQRFSLVNDGPGPWFGPIGIYVPTRIADAAHFPPELSAADCTWKFEGQVGQPMEGDRVVVTTAPTATFAFNLRNTSDLCPWFPDGVAPFHIGTVNPGDRASGFADTNRDWLSVNRIRLPKVVPPGEPVTIPFGLTAAPGIANGDYNEFFRPVIEGKYWLTDIGMYVPVRKR
jgi:hypothetical protein